MTKATRDLYIVSTERTELYELLKKALGDGDTVEVILDRRRGERWARGEGWAERRSVERHYYDEGQLLRTIGVVLVSRDRRHAAPMVSD